MLLLFASFGCGAGPSASYRNAKGLGDRAYSSGRFDEAASAYASAHQVADPPRDAAEALYLEASSYRRSRAFDRARTTYERLMAEQPASNFARRAAFDLANLEIDAGNPQKGYEQYRKLTTSHANDGLARQAMERYLEHLESTAGDPVAWLRSIMPRSPRPSSTKPRATRWLATSRNPPIGRRARRLPGLRCAPPVPQGRALRRRPVARIAIGRKARKTRTSNRAFASMLAVRETSTMTGSYERPNFPGSGSHRGALPRRAPRPRHGAP